MNDQMQKHYLNNAIDAAWTFLRNERGYPEAAPLVPFRAEYRTRYYAHSGEVLTSIDVEFETAEVDIENLPSDAGADKDYAQRYYGYTIHADHPANQSGVDITVYAAICYHYTKEEKALLAALGKVEMETYTETRSYLRCG